MGLSTQVWRLVFSMWDHRNQVLHNTEMINSLSGLDIIKVAIKAEISKGLQGLDPIYAPYFQYSHQDIDNMKSVPARDWLLLIRRVRALQGIQYNDTISNSKSLQKWIGLNVPKKAYQDKFRFIRTGYAAA